MKKLVTHNGRFHYDEILASVILLKIYPDAVITRTRDEKIIVDGDVVYDVGSIFDPATCRFDHHQSTFFETFSEKYSIKLSSAGLIFKYYCEKYLSLYGITKENSLYEIIVDKIYKDIFLPADSVDNGYDNTSGEVMPRTVYALVGAFNILDDNKVNSKEQDKRFFEALEIIKIDFENYMETILVWISSYQYLENKIKEVEGEILILDHHCSTTLLLDMEKKYNKDIKYMIFESDKKYKIIAIPVEAGKYKTKKPLKAEWRGLRNEELSKISNIDNCIFVHSSGFLGVNLTLEGAIKMAEESLKA